MSGVQDEATPTSNIKAVADTVKCLIDNAWCIECLLYCLIIMEFDDLLSTALCEAGLDEFVPTPEPSPSNVSNHLQSTDNRKYSKTVDVKNIIEKRNDCKSPIVANQRTNVQPRLIRTGPVNSSVRSNGSGDIIAVKSFSHQPQHQQRLLVVRKKRPAHLMGVNSGGAQTIRFQRPPIRHQTIVQRAQNPLPSHLHAHAYSSPAPPTENGTTRTMIIKSNSPQPTTQSIRRCQSTSSALNNQRSPISNGIKSQIGPYPILQPRRPSTTTTIINAPVIQSVDTKIIRPLAPQSPAIRSTASPRIPAPAVTRSVEMPPPPIISPIATVRSQPILSQTPPIHQRIKPDPPIITLPSTPPSTSNLQENKQKQSSDVKNLEKVSLNAKKPKPEASSPIITLNESIIDEDDEENLGHADTYSDYVPAKLRSGLPHPDSVVETASLSSVPPPDIRYHISIPEEVVDTGAISALQLEAVIYACQQHENRLPNGDRCGYLIGDGAGVGKGRTVAAIIFENYQLGRKRAIWFSVSADLKYDAQRDLSDIGASKIKVSALNKFKYAKISGRENGSIKKGVIFATYSSLIGECRTAKGKYRSRLKQLIHWCGKEFDGVIVFDECHRAKNLVPIGSTKPTKTGKAVLELQRALPNARVVYASATGATETRNMAYMTRLGLWGEGKAFLEFTDFLNAVEKRGVGAMEIVAMDMKQRGLYMARQLSFNGVSFRIEEVPLSKDFIKVYDESVKLWLEARKHFQLAADLVEAERAQRKSMWGQFWAGHQRFFKYLCINAKVRVCVKMAREAVRNGKCVVIGLQSTGEARTLEQLDECGGELNDFVSTAKAVFMSLIDRHFPSGATKAIGQDFGDDIFGSLDFIMGETPKLGQGRSTSPADEPPAKRRRQTSDSSNSSDDEESDDENSNSEISDDDNSDNNDKKEEGDDWLQTLFDEAASSSDENNEDSSDDQKSNKGDGDDDDDSFNPFADDLTEDDHWASKQQQVDEASPEKPVLKNDKATQKEKKKTKRKKKKRTSTNAHKDTADQFLAGTHNVEIEPIRGSGRMASELNINRASVIKAELMAAVERLGNRLPPNTLDQLIDELGGPDQVAEMTGRKGRVVTREDGEIEYQLRHEEDVALELLNITEKDRFMNGTKHIAIISEAASSGISLQSDRRVANQRRRVHITLELPWSADKAIQQFGRTHRSNQVNAPEYVFLISELAGEKRFASIVAKRLESLGALTHGDRRATETRDLSEFNVDTKFGRAALEMVYRTVMGVQLPLVQPPTDYEVPNFLNDIRSYLEGVGMLCSDNKGNVMMEKDAGSISKFLNRILGLPVHAQNALFKYFSDTVNELVAQAKRDGQYDMGILDLGIGGDHVKKMETRVFLGRVDEGGFRTEIHKIGVERGLPWSDVMSLYMQHKGPDDGFYISGQACGGKRTACLLYAIGKKRLETGERLFSISRPNTGRNARLETMSELKKRFKRVLPDEAQSIWKDQFESSASMCQHTYHFGRCRNENAGIYCEIGRRTRTYFVLSGSVLSVWPVVESVLQTSQSRRQSKMQVIRVRTDQGQKIVGLLIPAFFVRKLIERLEEQTGRSYLETSVKKPL